MPNLNVDLIAGGYFGYHAPMSEDIKNKLRKERGHNIYVYDLSIFNLIYISDSKQFLIDNINLS
jgi:hypothetical protein